MENRDPHTKPSVIENIARFSIVTASVHLVSSALLALEHFEPGGYLKNLKNAVRDWKLAGLASVVGLLSLAPNLSTHDERSFSKKSSDSDGVSPEYGDRKRVVGFAQRISEENSQGERTSKER